jgi:hypothetical protein
MKIHGEWKYCVLVEPRFLDLGIGLRWVVSFTPRPLYPFEWRPDWPQSRFRPCGEGKLLDTTRSHAPTSLTSSVLQASHNLVNSSLFFSSFLKTEHRIFMPVAQPCETWRSNALEWSFSLLSYQKMIWLPWHHHLTSSPPFCSLLVFSSPHFYLPSSFSGLASIPGKRIFRVFRVEWMIRDVFVWSACSVTLADCLQWRLFASRSPQEVRRDCNGTVNFMQESAFWETLNSHVYENEDF